MRHLIVFVIAAILFLQECVCVCLPACLGTAQPAEEFLLPVTQPSFTSSSGFSVSSTSDEYQTSRYTLRLNRSSLPSFSLGPRFLEVSLLYEHIDISGILLWELLMP